MSRIFVDLENNGLRFILRFSYDEAFVKLLKETVPPREREWDSKVKLWAVDRKWWFAIKDVIKNHFGEENMDFRSLAAAAAIEEMIEEVAEADYAAYQQLGIRTDAHHCVVHAAYLSLERDWVYAMAIIKRTVDDRASSGPPPSLDHTLNLPQLDALRKAYRAICEQRDLPPAKPIATADCWNGRGYGNMAWKSSDDLIEAVRLWSTTAWPI